MIVGNGDHIRERDLVSEMTGTTIKEEAIRGSIKEFPWRDYIVNLNLRPSDEPVKIKLGQETFGVTSSVEAMGTGGDTVTSVFIPPWSIDWARKNNLEGGLEKRDVELVADAKQAKRLLGEVYPFDLKKKVKELLAGNRGKSNIDLLTGLDFTMMHEVRRSLTEQLS